MGRSTVELAIRVGKLGSTKLESSRRIPVEVIDVYMLHTAQATLSRSRNARSDSGSG
jgi:hypothetical protein